MSYKDARGTRGLVSYRTELGLQSHGSRVMEINLAAVFRFMRSNSGMICKEGGEVEHFIGKEGVDI